MGKRLDAARERVREIQSKRGAAQPQPERDEGPLPLHDGDTLIFNPWSSPERRPTEREARIAGVEALAEQLRQRGY